METKPSSLSAHKSVLTDEEIRAVWVEHGLDDEAVEDFARAIESALLSKLRAPVAEERKETAGVTLDGCLETLFRVGEHLGIDYAESRKQPGAPSGIYIKAIEDRVSQAMNAAREEAAKLMDQTSRSSGATLIRAMASAPVAGEAISDVNILGLAGQYIQPREPESAPQILNFARALLSQYAAPQASEAVRILFPTHLRKMWSGGEVQAWLDEHQGVTTAKPSAKGSLQRYREWQANQDSGVANLRQAINTFGSKVFKALAAIARADGPDTRKEDDPELIYREPVMDEAVRIRQAYDELSAALSAQPGAQKGGGDA